MRRLLWVVDGAALDRNAAPGVLGAGVDTLHLRDPGIAPERWLERLDAWSALGMRFDVVVNSGPAWAAEASLGAHLKASQSALPVPERERWRLLGRSVHDADETRRALRDRPDYLVAGPLYPTASKPGHLGIGTAAFARIVEAAAGVPVLAIGGISPERVAAVAAAGGAGVALLSGITAAEDPAGATRAYREALDAAFLPANSR